jgi:hypothetical protein
MKGSIDARADLWPQRGYWKQRQQDCYLWEGRIIIEGMPSGVSLFSWDRMRDCVARGISLERESYLCYEVNARAAIAKAEGRA